MKQRSFRKIPGNRTINSIRLPERIGFPVTLPVFLTVLLLIPMVLSGCGKRDKSISSISQLKERGRIISVSDGAPEEVRVRADFPDATVLPFTDLVAAYTAVANGKADACIYSRRQMEVAIKNGVKGVHLLDDTYCENTVAVGISQVTPIPDLKGKINRFLQEIRDNGTLDDMFDRWVEKDEETMPDIPKPENPSGTLRVGTTGTVMPYSYYIGDQLAGFDIELATRFAAWLGMDLQFGVYSFGGIIAAAQLDEVDCIMSNLYYTEEHEEALDFSDPVLKEEVTAMVRDADAAAGNSGDKSFWGSIASSFEKTFIRENRWKLLLEGTGTTLLITVFAILIGTALGFFLYLVCRKGNRIANGLTGFLVRVVQGMPVVVFLMILYYVIFGRVGASNVSVSVIGFTIIFGVSVYLMLKGAIESLNRGQLEAAFEMGFSDRQVLCYIMLPQVLPHITQPFSEQITALIKATAIVGYIAVQDLTKMGDIIRSRTYEAFFPLITTAVIYFGLAWIMTSLVKWISRRIDPKQRRKKSLLKGVRINDRDQASSKRI